MLDEWLSCFGKESSSLGDIEVPVFVEGVFMEAAERMLIY